MRYRADDPSLSREPMDSDFDDLFDLFEDMKAFAAANLDHAFLTADDPGFGDPPRLPRMGWVAFLPAVTQGDDEQMKSWTITVVCASRSLKGTKGALLRKTLGPSKGRRQMLQELVKRARAPQDPPQSTA